MTARPGADAALGGFGGLFDLKAAGFKDPLLVASTDGVGTKLKIAIETGRFDTIGQDLVAMCVNDIVVKPMIAASNDGTHERTTSSYRIVDGLGQSSPGQGLIFPSRCPWPIADSPLTPLNVRYWGQSGHRWMSVHDPERTLGLISVQGRLCAISHSPPGRQGAR